MKLRNENRALVTPKGDVIADGVKKTPKTKEVVARTEWCIRFGGCMSKYYPSMANAERSRSLCTQIQ